MLWRPIEPYAGHLRLANALKGEPVTSPLRNIEPSPRVRTAAWLYVSGAAKTKREASALAGLHPNYLTMMSNESLPTKRLMNDIQQMIENEALDSSIIMKKLGRRALGKLNTLMDSANENVALKAAQDLADRSPETSKTQKIDVGGGLTLGTLDAKALATALVESARERAKYDHVAEHGLVEVDMGESVVVGSISPKSTVPTEEIIEDANGPRWERNESDGR